MKTSIVLFLLVCSTAVGGVTVIDVNSVLEGEVYDFLVVDVNTIVDMNNCSANRIVLKKGAILTAANLTIDDSNSSNGLVLYRDSNAVISSGTFDASLGSTAIVAYGSSKLEITGTATTPGIRVYDTASLTVSGGTINRVLMYDTSSLLMTGGSITNELYFDSFDGDVQLRGGSVDLGNIIRPVSTEIQVVGKSLSIAPYGGTYGFGQVAGLWNDDTPFSINFKNNANYNYVLLYDDCEPGECVGVAGGDLNEDCTVNLEDFAMMADNWMQ